jgi:YD repeat-containing protein
LILLTVRRCGRPFVYRFVTGIVSRLGDCTISYTYDKVGNRLTETVNIQTDIYTYVSGTNRLDAISGTTNVSLAYDANGNITGMGGKTLAYNQDNRLASVVESGTTVAAYTYNGRGERVKKVVGSNTTIYHYDFG